MTEIFVFGSNLAGRHGRGAALFARGNYGAMQGRPIGLQGNSWAIPTKDKNFKTLPLIVIEEYIEDFLNYAENHPEDTFLLTAIGTGLAGYNVDQIRGLFKGKEIPKNIEYIGDSSKNIIRRK